MRSLIAGAALFAALPVAAADMAALFAARPAAFRAALSPDGDRIVYLGAYKTSGRAVMLADLKTGKTNVVIASSDLTLEPQSCSFKTQTRLICSMYGILGLGAGELTFSRTVAIDIDGDNGKVLGQESMRQRDAAQGGGYVVDWLPDDPDHVLMQVTNDIERTPAIARVNVQTGVRTLVERPNVMDFAFRSDNRGNVRFKTTIERSSGYVRDKVDYWVRAKNSRSWSSLGTGVMSDQSAMSYEGFDDGGDHVFVLKQLDGRKAMYRTNVDGSNTSTLVYAHPKVDVDGLSRIGKYNRPVGASYIEDRSTVYYFDAKLDRLSKAFSKALSSNPTVNIEDESWNGTKLLIYTDSNNSPGRYYLFDTSTKKLVELVATHPALDGVKLGTVKSVRYAARDGTIIPGFLTLPPGRADVSGLPVLMMPHGGPSARDVAGFDWLTQFFAAAGYAVLQPNFRGSTGYGADFFGKNGFQAWQVAVGDINDGARWLVSQGADAKRLAIFGWSYGGYAALQANVVEPKLYRATVSVAPVTDLQRLRSDAVSYSNFKLIDRMIGQGPHVLAGSPAKHADAFIAPVLIFHADRDLNVDVRQGRIMASALRGAGKKVELIEYKGLDHQIDDSEARRDMLTRSAAFLAAALN